MLILRSTQLFKKNIYIASFFSLLSTAYTKRQRAKGERGPQDDETFKTQLVQSPSFYKFHILHFRKKKNFFFDHLQPPPLKSDHPLLPEKKGGFSTISSYIWQHLEPHHYAERRNLQQNLQQRVNPTAKILDSRVIDSIQIP